VGESMELGESMQGKAHLGPAGALPSLCARRNAHVRPKYLPTQRQFRACCVQCRKPSEEVPGRGGNRHARPARRLHKLLGRPLAVARVEGRP
jgi:hypothetical protein